MGGGDGDGEYDACMDCGASHDKPNFDCEGDCMERDCVQQHID